MRYRHITPYHGQPRILTRFLWLPKQIGDETRWLETASWLEKYYAPPSSGLVLALGGRGENCWVAEKWADA